MEADGIRRGVTDPPAAFRHHLVGASQLLAVIAEHQAALMHQSETADVAVVSRFQPATVVVLAALDGDVLHALSKRAVGQDRRRVGVRNDESAVPGRGAKALDQVQPAGP